MMLSLLHTLGEPCQSQGLALPLGCTALWTGSQSEEDRSLASPSSHHHLGDTIGECGLRGK